MNPNRSQQIYKLLLPQKIKINKLLSQQHKKNKTENFSVLFSVAFPKINIYIFLKQKQTEL